MKRIYTRQTPQVKMAKVNARIMKMQAVIEKKQARVAQLLVVSHAHQAEIDAHTIETIVPPVEVPNA